MKLCGLLLRDGECCSGGKGQGLEMGGRGETASPQTEWDNTQHGAEQRSEGQKSHGLLPTSECVATHPNSPQRSGAMVEKSIRSARDGQR